MAVAALAPADAQTFAALPGQEFSLDLDVKEGAFSQWRNRDVGAITAFRATMQILRLGVDRKWNPYFFICVETADGCSGSAFGTDHAKPPIRVFSLLNMKTGDPTGETITLGAKVNIAMDWGSPGKLTFRLGDGKVHEMALSGPVTGLIISASTGEFMLDPIALGKVSP